MRDFHAEPQYEVFTAADGEQGLRPTAQTIIAGQERYIQLLRDELDGYKREFRSMCEAEDVCESIEAYDQVEKLHRNTQRALATWRSARERS